VRLLTVPDDGWAELLRWSRGQGTPARMAERIRIVLLAASGVTDPLLDAKDRDVMGLYLNPPENAVVVCADESPNQFASRRSARGQAHRAVLALRPHTPKSWRGTVASTCCW
jgi:hypothetical protein